MAQMAREGGAAIAIFLWLSINHLLNDSMTESFTYLAYT